MTAETTAGLTSDLRVVSTEKLPTPDELASQIPLTDTARETILSGRSQVQNILSGKDSRLLVVAGPCSVHDEKAALDYADRLVKLADEVKDQICVVMRLSVCMCLPVWNPLKSLPLWNHTCILSMCLSGTTHVF